MTESKYEYFEKSDVTKATWKFILDNFLLKNKEQEENNNKYIARYIENNRNESVIDDKFIEFGLSVFSIPPYIKIEKELYDVYVAIFNRLKYEIDKIIFTKLLYIGRLIHDNNSDEINKKNRIYFYNKFFEKLGNITYNSLESKKNKIKEYTPSIFKEIVLSEIDFLLSSRNLPMKKNDLWRREGCLPLKIKLVATGSLLCENHEFDICILDSTIKKEGDLLKKIYNVVKKGLEENEANDIPLLEEILDLKKDDKQNSSVLKTSGIRNIDFYEDFRLLMTKKDGSTYHKSDLTVLYYLILSHYYLVPHIFFHIDYSYGDVFMNSFNAEALTKHPSFPDVFKDIKERMKDILNIYK